MLFSRTGDVMSVKIVSDRQTGQPRGIAFVEMSTQWEARRVISMLNKTDFWGKNLLVEKAIVRRGFGADSHKNLKTVIRMERSQNG